MRHSDVIASLRRWEEAFPVATWAVGDLHVWPLIRAQLAQRLLATGRPPVPHRRDPGGLAHHALSLATGRLRSRAATSGRIPHAEAVILTRPANRQPIDGQWYDRLFDPLTDIFESGGWNVLHLEHRSNGSLHHTPRYRPALVTRSAVTRRNVLAALRSLRGLRLDGYDAFAWAVSQDHPGVAAPSPVWVARRARSVGRAARFFEDVLRRASARLALCSVYYTLVGGAFCLAARRAGIPAVDVQHGVTLGNPAYEGWTRFPAGGYAVLPAWFWSWSEADAAPVASWPEGARPHHRTIPGGHPWMARWEAAHPIGRASALRLPPRAVEGVTVLVTLTWSSGFSDILQRLVREAPAAWRWWIRLHPLMTRQRREVQAWCDAHARGRAWVEAPSDLPLPLLLTHADVHLTHNSSVVQEAARAGLPSVVVDPHALDVYPELHSGWAVFAADTRAALDALASRGAAVTPLPRLAPYPSWSALSEAVRQLMTLSPSCPATASAASCPTHARV